MGIERQAEQWPERTAEMKTALDGELADRFRDALANDKPIDDEMAAHLEWVSNLLGLTQGEFGAVPAHQH